MHYVFGDNAYNFMRWTVYVLLVLQCQSSMLAWFVFFGFMQCALSLLHNVILIIIFDKNVNL